MLLNDAYKIALKKIPLQSRVEVVIFNNEGYVLIGNNPKYDVYMFPGGHIENNETPVDAAKRETAEEFGIGLTGIELIGEKPFIDLPHQQITIFATGKSRGEKPTKEFDNIDFVTVESAMELLRKSTINSEYKELLDARIEALRTANGKLEKKAIAKLLVFDELGNLSINPPTKNIYPLKQIENFLICLTGKNEVLPETLKISDIGWLSQSLPTDDFTDILQAFDYFQNPNETLFKDCNYDILYNIKPSKIEGVGIIAKIDITKDTNIGKSCTCTDGFMDRTVLGRFINHSDDPTCIELSDGSIIAKYDLSQGDEICVDYNQVQQALGIPIDMSFMQKKADVIIQDSIDPAEEVMNFLTDTPEQILSHSVELLEDIDDEEYTLKEHLIKESHRLLLESKHVKMGAKVSTVGQILINDYLPEEFRDYSRVITKSSIGDVLRKVADKYPDQYAKISDNLRYMGDRESIFSLRQLQYKDMHSPIKIDPYLEKARKEYEILNKKFKNEDYARAMAYGGVKEQLGKDLIEAGNKEGNLFTNMVLSGSRGSVSNVTDILVGPLLVSDYKNKPIPIEISNSYAKGLTPAQYFAASYGSRRGMISTKLATPLAGYFGKMMSWSMSPQVVTEVDCHTDNGSSYSIDDKWNIGKYLARQTGQYPKNTYLTKEVLDDLKKQDIKTIIVRNPISCEAEQGICQKCMGKTELGKDVPIGYNAGVNTATSISEILSQGMLNEKHTGGAIKKRIGGYPLIDKLVSIPKVFSDKSVLSTVHGKVESISKNPWGGWKIVVSGTEHNVPEEAPPVVKEGDIIERGDSLTEGIMNPADVTSLKGVGQGRKSLATELRNAYIEMGNDIDRTHPELVARSLINFVQVEDKVGDYLPGEIGRLDNIKKYIAFKNVEQFDVKNAPTFNIYLAKPILHYFPGTEFTDKVKKDLLDNGILKIFLTKEKPKFQPIMIRAEDTTRYDKDWVNRLSSQGLKKNLLEAVHKGYGSSSESDINFVHPFIHGLTFGKKKNY